MRHLDKGPEIHFPRSEVLRYPFVYCILDYTSLGLIISAAKLDIHYQQND